MRLNELTQSSKETLKRGSKSFSLAARFFSRELREDVAHLYSWCRWCDDVADGSTLGFGQNPEGLPMDRIELLKVKSQRAILDQENDIDALIAFGKVMRKHKIPWLYAEDLLKGMQHDVAGEVIKNLDELLLYCYRVAGTVGLMMCHIMGLKTHQALEKAVHLGIALQLTNIIRDIGDDFRVSKVYLPESWLSDVGLPKNDLLNSKYESALITLAKRLSAEADRYYKSGLSGLIDLSWRSALAVAIAARIYRRIGTQTIKQGHVSWSDAGRVRNGLRRWDQIQACISGFFLFLRTVPSRIFTHRENISIDQVWRYSS